MGGNGLWYDIRVQWQLIFVRLTGMHLWRSDYGPFIRKTQLDYCRRLIVVPLSTFHHLAEVIGDPKGEIIFLFGTARCGSTLLTQVTTHENMLCPTE